MKIVKIQFCKSLHVRSALSLELPFENIEKCLRAFARKSYMFRRVSKVSSRNFQRRYGHADEHDTDSIGLRLFAIRLFKHQLHSCVPNLRDVEF